MLDWVLSALKHFLHWVFSCHFWTNFLWQSQAVFCLNSFWWMYIRDMNASNTVPGMVCIVCFLWIVEPAILFTFIWIYWWYINAIYQSYFIHKDSTCPSNIAKLCRMKAVIRLLDDLECINKCSYYRMAKFKSAESP